MSKLSNAISDMTWTDSPQYLKGIQKIRAMSPEKKAVTQTLVNELSAMYAGEDMQKQLTAMRQASTDKARDRSYEMGRGRLDLSRTLGEGELDLAREGIKYAKDEADTAETLGYLNIGLSGVSGLSDIHHKKKQTKLLESLASKFNVGV